ARAIALVELPKSNPSTRRPSTSPMMRASGHRRRRAKASSTAPTSTTSDAPRSKAWAAVLKARKTSMTTASPRASRAPLSSRRRCTAIMVQQQGVRAQPLTDGLERDDVLGRHVAHVHVGSEVLDEPHLLGLARRLEDDPAGIHLHLDLVDESCLDLAGGVVDAARPRLATLDDHLPGACRDLALDLIDPSLGRDDVGPVLAPHLGEHGEVLRQPLDVSELLGEGDLDGAVGDLDVLEVVGLEERDVLAQLLAVHRELEQAPTAAHGDAVSPERLELGLEVLHHHRRRPAELDDVDVARAHLEHALDLADGKALVEHLREADLAW